MLYLTDRIVHDLGTPWKILVDVIGNALSTKDQGDFAQPIKPYLRYRDLKNRIIAMPAFVGGETDTAGIKWIASFPSNLDKSIPRAHAVTVLNNSLTGEPMCILNSTLISGIRTAAVSGLVLQRYLDSRKSKVKKLNAGVIGLGPIGRLHIQMLNSLLGERLDTIYVFDKRTIDISQFGDVNNKVQVCKTWREVFSKSDVFTTCTVSDQRYIDLEPMPGSLQLNVSLRDFQPQCRKFMDVIVVDDWEEVCRENTDIELMYKQGLLTKKDALDLHEFVIGNRKYDSNETIMFNPMGMAVFDIAISSYYYKTALREKLGIVLPD